MITMYTTIRNHSRFNKCNFHDFCNKYDINIENNTNYNNIIDTVNRFGYIENYNILKRFSSFCNNSHYTLWFLSDNSIYDTLYNYFFEKYN